LIFLRKYFIHIGLFIATFCTTTFAGLEWTSGKTFLFSKGGIGFGKGVNTDDWRLALFFSCSFLFILTVHEFGHYLTGIYYKVKVTLPYYIPLWFFGLGPSIGTMGAFIKIKSPLKTTKEFFDVGIAGPLTGFVAAFFIIWYGFANLPSTEYLYKIHPDYRAVFEKYGVDTEEVYTYRYQKEQYIKNSLKERPNEVPNPPDSFDNISLGNNLLFCFFRWIYAEKTVFIPNGFELMHYPFLFAGYLACFFTALNLIPIGQLDGGHVMYGLIGYKRFNKVAPYLYILFLFYAGLGLISPAMSSDDLVVYVPLYLLFLNLCLQQLYANWQERLKWILLIFLLQTGVSYLFPSFDGYQGWLLFGLLIGRFLGVKHPPALVEQDIGWKRKVLGWVAVLVFIVCFSPHPFMI